MRRRSTLAALAGLLLSTALVPSAQAAGPTLGGARLIDSGPGLLGSPYTVLTLELDLTDPVGLPDRLTNFETQPYPVAYGSLDHDGFVVEAATDVLPRGVSWDLLQRVSGSSIDGTWRGAAVVSSVSTGRVTLDEATVTDLDGDATTLPFPAALGVDLPTTSTSAPWAYQPVGTVKVVTGRETWHPAVRVTTRAGAPVVGALTYAQDVGFGDRVSADLTQFYGSRGEQPSTEIFRYTTGTGGLLTLPAAYPLTERPLMSTLAGWGRTNRYHTQMAVGQPLLVVKWQASSSFAAGPGDVITVTGNAWPAPSVYRAANATVHLQRLVGRTWRTEASGTVRANGRFTVVWDAPDAAGYWVRAYKPGGATDDGQSAGTTGPAVWVATP